MNAVIATIPDLEARIGVAGLPVKMKIIDHLDAEAARWIGQSPIAFVGVGCADGPRLAVAGGRSGFAEARGPHVLAVPAEAIDGPIDHIQPGAGAGVLFLVPGVGETLRANGKVATVSEDGVEIAVEACFVHCAKALIRSDFWAGSAEAPPADAAAFLNAARFLALATMDAEGRVDVSPKGDPAGGLIRFDGERACLAERPGNRLAFGYRNMIDQPKTAAVGLIPGAGQLVSLSGEARLTADESLRAGFVVDGKTPILVTAIEGVQPQLHASGALERAALWARPPATPQIDPAGVLMAHVKLNKARGEEADWIRQVVDRDRVAQGLASNYKTDLY